MRGILGWGTYIPYRRLDRSTIAAVAGTGGGKGHRSVAAYDEDTTTMGVEAARAALCSDPRCGASASLVHDGGACLPRQDERDHHPRCAPARSGRGGVRRAGLGEVGGRRTRRGPRQQRQRPRRGERSPHRTAGLAPTRPPAATRQPPSSSAVTPTATCLPSSSDRAWPPRSSSTDGASPARTVRGCGRNGSARPATPPSPRLPSGPRSKRPGSRPPTSTTSSSLARMAVPTPPFPARRPYGPTRWSTRCRPPSATPARPNPDCSSPPRSSGRRPDQVSRSSCSPTASMCCSSGPPTALAAYSPRTFRG